jgi:hypothetical protein
MKIKLKGFKVKKHLFKKQDKTFLLYEPPLFLDETVFYVNKR